MKQYEWTLAVSYPANLKQNELPAGLNEGIDELAEFLGVQKVDPDDLKEAGTFISSPTGGAYRIPEITLAVLKLIISLKRERWNENTQMS